MQEEDTQPVRQTIKDGSNHWTTQLEHGTGISELVGHAGSIAHTLPRESLVHVQLHTRNTHTHTHLWIHNTYPPPSNWLTPPTAGGGLNQL